MSDHADSKLRKIPLQARETLDAFGRRSSALSAFCPGHEKSVGVEVCVKCPHCVAVTSKPGGFVQCTPAEKRPVAASPVAYRTQRLDTAERAARICVGEVVNRNVFCVRATTSVDALRALLLEKDLDCAPVVDENGGPIGIVSKTDLVRPGVDTSGPVGKIMTACVHALPEGSTLAHAFALMTLQHLHHVPIVSVEGVVVGLLTALDALRWVTEGWGYVSFDGSVTTT
ncbi:MAG: CBS domain-containing protein [Polyangiaceae bacterium]